MQFFFHPLNTARRQRLPSLFALAEWVVSNKNASSIFPQPKERLCQSRRMCLPKVGLKGILSQRVFLSLQPDSTKQQILGIKTLDSQQKLQSSENKLKREWLKKKTKKNYKLAGNKLLKAKDAHSKKITYFVCHVSLLTAL